MLVIREKEVARYEFVILKEAWLPRILCGHAAVSNSVKVKFGLSEKWIYAVAAIELIMKVQL